MSLEDKEAALHAAQDNLAVEVERNFPVGSKVVLVNGAGRRMLCTVTYIGTGSSAGNLKLMPINGKKGVKSITSSHWRYLEQPAEGE